MAYREKVIKRLEECFSASCRGFRTCPYSDNEWDAVQTALALLKAQEPRVMALEEVEALPYGHVIIETDKDESIRWVDALLFCKNINFSFDFITLEGRARLLGVEYNKEWRCWTARPTDEQRKATPWEPPKEEA